MSPAVSSKYMAMADAETAAAYEPRTPFVGLNVPSTAALRCFQRFSKDSTRDLYDGDNVKRWVTQKQSAVAAIIARVAMSPTPSTTMKDVAAEAGCTVSTVSRAIQKLQAFALYAIDIRRGRHGGITIHRKGFDRFWDYVREARYHIKQARIRAQEKLASVIPGVGSSPSTVLGTTVASFTRTTPMSFASKVFYERAMLALEDPDGEYEALHPITDVENALLLAEDERRRKDQAIREAAYRGDWETWEHLRKQRWDQ